MFNLEWTERALREFKELEQQIEKSRYFKDKSKKSRQEGLFQQIVKALKLLKNNPRHPGLNTHPYSSIEHPFAKDEKVFEAYVQNNTPGAYRVFWCYGPQKKEITIIAITPHP